VLWRTTLTDRNLSTITADLVGIPAAAWLVAAMTLASGVVVAVRMDSLPTRDEVAFAM